MLVFILMNFPMFFEPIRFGIRFTIGGDEAYIYSGCPTSGQTIGKRNLSRKRDKEKGANSTEIARRSKLETSSAVKFSAKRKSLCNECT